MIKQITGTIASRIAITGMGMLLTMVAGHRLGINGLGTIALLVLGISLVGLLANVLGSGAMVYLVPRVPLRKLLLPAHAWVVIACAAGGPLLQCVDLVPQEFILHVPILAAIQTAGAIHLGVLIGQQRIRTHNQITVLQAVVMLFVLTAFVLPPLPTAMAFVHAAYVAYGLTFVLTLIALRTGPKPSLSTDQHPLRMLVRQGLLVQSANAMQLLNYRLAYWLIEKYRGLAPLGLYTVATQLAEGAWLAPKSLGLVLYSRMSNTTDPTDQRRLTLLFLKLSLAFATAIVVLLLLMPGAVLSFAFGPDVQGLFPILLLLSPGILAIAAAQALSHYFSGTGNNVHNVISSGLGMVITIALGLWAVPAHGLIGAAITASCAYIAQCSYQVIAFQRLTKGPWGDLLPNASDVPRAKHLWKELLRR